MIKSNPCKLCGSIYHTAAFCRDRKTLAAKKAVKPKVKKVSRSKLKKQLDKLVKDYVKERDDHTCQHCLKKVSGVSCQASHVFSVGSCPQLQFEPLNIKVLCAYCHLRWWHSSPIEATEWFNNKFPERLLELELLKRTTTKISTFDLQIKIDEYKAKLKDL